MGGVHEPSGQDGAPFFFSVADTKGIFAYPDHSGRKKIIAAATLQLSLKIGIPPHPRKM
jgi:hypothetical protein